MSYFEDIQRKIDSLGYYNAEISRNTHNKNISPVLGRDESDWYVTSIYGNVGDRRNRLNEYEEMSKYAEIGSALDIYADDATQRDSEGYIVRIRSENKGIQEELEALLYDRVNISSIIWRIVRTTCLYGDAFGELILSADKDNVVGIKLLPPKTMLRIEENGSLKCFAQDVPNGRPVLFAPFEIVHWRLYSTIHSYLPYGTSILESARISWRQLKIMEDAMVVYRVTRAPERRVFKIDIGNMPTPQAEAFIESQRMKFRKKPLIKDDGTIDYRANVMAPDEDFWIGVRNGSGTEIEELGGADNLGEIDDVKYFKDKIFAALKIPRIYLQDTEGTEERKQNVSQQDIMFARVIGRVQEQIIEGLRKIATVQLILRGYDDEVLDDFVIEMTPPSHLNERIKLEILDERNSVADSLVDFGFSREYVVQNVFKMHPDDWKKIRVDRFHEFIEEEQVESGEWGEQGEGEEGFEEPDDVGSTFAFEDRKQRTYHKLLVEGELSREIDKSTTKMITESLQNRSK